MTQSRELERDRLGTRENGECTCAIDATFQRYLVQSEAQELNSSFSVKGTHSENISRDGSDFRSNAKQAQGHK